MASYSTLKISRVLQSQSSPFVSLHDIQRLFHIQNQHLVYSMTKRLVAAKVLDRIANGLFIMKGAAVNEFEMANSMYTPSYVSLESALSFYGILSQFPYTVTSMTTKKTKTLTYRKSYEYAHISSSLYWGFIKKDAFLIATPEKALIDLLYFASKGLRAASVDEFDLSVIQKSEFFSYCSKIQIPAFQQYVKTNVRL